MTRAPMTAGADLETPIALDPARPAPGTEAAHTSSGTGIAGSVAPAGSAAPVAPGLPTLGLVVVLVGTFLAVADFFVVNVALGDIAARLHASTALLELVVSGYGLSYAVLLVLGGRIGDARGRRSAFTAGLLAFTVASLACGLAPDAAWLVGLRVLQGAAAALMVPQVLGTIHASTAGAERARAVSWFGATAGVAGIVGQIGGGMIVSADLGGAGWRPVFLVNVPIGLAALLFVRRVVPQTRAPRPDAPDIPGALLLAATLVAVLLPLSLGSAQGWPAWSLVLLAAALPLAALLVAVERGRERAGLVPMVPPSLLRLPSLGAAVTTGAPFFVGFGGFMFVFALVTQRTLGWSPVASGAWLAPMLLPFLVTSLLTPRLLRRWGSRTITAGMLVQVSGLALLATSVRLDWPFGGGLPWLAVAGLVLAGAGQGAAMSPLFGVALADVSLTRAGLGSAVMTTTQQVSLAIGATAAGTAFTHLAAGGTASGAWSGVLTAQALVSLGCAALSLRLPGRGRG